MARAARLPRPINDAVAVAIAERLRVLGQPVRVRLIDVLEREEEMSVGALAETVGESVHNVSQHLAVLRSAGIVRGRRHGREVLYRLVGGGALRVYERAVETLVEEADRLGGVIDRTD